MDFSDIDFSLLYYILKFIPLNDQKSLAVCSKAWYKKLQRSLWSSVSFSWPTEKDELGCKLLKAPLGRNISLLIQPNITDDHDFGTLLQQLSRRLRRMNSFKLVVYNDTHRGYIYYSYLPFSELQK